MDLVPLTSKDVCIQSIPDIPMSSKKSSGSHREFIGGLL